MKKKSAKPVIDIGWREWISLVDFNDFFADDFGQKETDSSHNKPSITGFKIE